MKTWDEDVVCDNAALALMVGRTFVSVDNGGDIVTFTDTAGNVWEMSHSQSCCEDVRIEDVCGDLDDLIGTPVVSAECVSGADDPADHADDYSDSHTWTFYNFRTAKGDVSIRWLGESNGYYSETVDVMVRVPLNA